MGNTRFYSLMTRAFQLAMETCPFDDDDEDRPMVFFDTSPQVNGYSVNYYPNGWKLGRDNLKIEANVRSWSQKYQEFEELLDLAEKDIRAYREKKKEETNDDTV